METRARRLSIKRVLERINRSNRSRYNTRTFGESCPLLVHRSSPSEHYSIFLASDIGQTSTPPDDMDYSQRLRAICLLVLLIDIVHATWRTHPKRVTAEQGSDLSLSCTFQDEDSDKTIVQWLYQNLTDPHSNVRTHKPHWRPLFLNAQSLTPSETRYSIQQKIQQLNETSIAYSTILTLAKVTDADEGLYMCKSLSPKTIQMAYQVRVIQSLDITPKQIIIPADETGQYSIRLNCILTDNNTGRRHHEIHWWHNNKRLGANSNRQARIIKNSTQHSFISTLFYTGEPANIAGSYVCESDPLRKYISVELESNKSPSLFAEPYWILLVGLFTSLFL